MYTIEYSGQFKKSVKRCKKRGLGCIIRSSASISCDVMVGDLVTIMSYCVLGHDVKVADWTHIGAHCFMGDILY